MAKIILNIDDLLAIATTTELKLRNDFLNAREL
jgi:hypothetical protein